MKRTVYLLAFNIALFSSCNQSLQKEKNTAADTKEVKPSESEKIQVLNFGTFHMGLTSDANTVAFNERDSKNRQAVHDVAKMLASFKPTVILVEKSPEFNKELKESYSSYLKNPEIHFEQPSEIELLAFELGRLSDVKKIYGIDHKMGYNYMIGHQIENAIDTTWYNRYYKNPLKHSGINTDLDSLNLLEKLVLTNSDKYLDFLITVNADMLTHAGTENSFEGADEAAKFYQRNLRMYSNLNRIPLNKNDRVFILMGGAHTAFFRDFMSRSPKYEMVNTFDYLK